MDDNLGSVSCWLEELKAGRPAAAQQLWERHFRRLAGLARKKLGDFSRRVIDEEDVVLSAFQSFCRRAKEGQFPELSDRDDLWRLLAVVTARNAANQMAHLRRAKRGKNRVAGQSLLRGADGSDGLAEIIGAEPTPEFAAQFVEEVERMMASLEDPALRVIALWKLEGRTNPEISQHLDCSLSAVERKLRLIRQRIDAHLRRGRPEHRMSVDEHKPDSLDADAALIDGLCDEFERAWKQGASPRIEDYVRRAGGETRTALVELLKVEIELRQQLRDVVRADDYLQRFAGFEQEIREALSHNGLSLATEALGAHAAHADRGEPRRAETAKRGFDPSETDVASPTPVFPDDQLSSPSTIDHEHTPTKREPSSRSHSSRSKPSPAAESDRFQKIRSHAAGGMGQVWVALDTQIRREVALKVLKEERKHDRAICERFLAEGHITGVLEHPGIVPVYALGVDGDEQAYYAMRFIRGESLRHAIKAFHGRKGADGQMVRNNAHFRELLRRLADVCVTIAYAHSRGVLHRDLKPDNVMLGKYGETYVVDWGMARLLDAPAEEVSQASLVVVRPESLDSDSGTRYGSAMGTPGFMSPEQAAGRIDELSVATDVYSLGAVLYFLLTNKVSITADTLPDFLRKVEAGEIEPPQVVLPQAPTGLCAICQKAMAQEPADRYLSARDLAADIEQWLADEPLAAAPDTPWQRTARFARRHYRWLTPLVAALTVTTVTALFAAASINGARRRADESAAAEAQAKSRAESNFLEFRNTVDEWLTGFTEAVAFYPSPAVDEFRHLMLEEAASRYEQFVKQASDDDVVQLEAGRTYMRLGDVRRQLRATTEATAAYGEAVKVFERLMNKRSAEAARSDLARAYGRLALAYNDAGDAARARAAHEQALDTAAASGDAGTSEDQLRQRRELQATLGDLEINYAVFLAMRRDMPEAANRFASAIKRLQALASEDPGRMETRTSLATALLGWGQVVYQNGDSAKAREIFQQAARYFEGAAQIADDSPRELKLSADAQLYLAIVTGNLGDQEGEAQSYREIIETYDRLLVKLPNSPQLQETRAQTQFDLGLVLVSLGDVDAAQPIAAEAEAAFSALLAAAPDHPPFREAHATALNLQSTVAAIQGNRSDAILAARAALAEFESLATTWPDVPQYQNRAATCQSHLAQVLALDQQFEEADKEFTAAMQRLDAAIALYADDPALRQAAAMTASRWGEAKSLAGDEAGATELAAQSAQHWQRLLELSTDGQYLAGAACHYAMFPVPDARSPERAAEYAAAAAKQAPENKYYAALAALGELRRGRAAESLAAATRLKEVARNNAFIGPLAGYIASLAHAALGDGEEALRAFDEAVAQSEQQPGRWELRMLRRECETALQPSGAEAASAE